MVSNWSDCHCACDLLVAKLDGLVLLALAAFNTAESPLPWTLWTQLPLRLLFRFFSNPLGSLSSFAWHLCFKVPLNFMCNHFSPSCPILFLSDCLSTNDDFILIILSWTEICVSDLNCLEVSSGWVHTCVCVCFNVTNSKRNLFLWKINLNRLTVNLLLASQAQCVENRVHHNFPQTSSKSSPNP